MSRTVDDDDEMRKRITSHVLASDEMVLIDNVPNGGMIGWPSLDNALTAGIWRDRILRTNLLTPPLPFQITWYVTGNNLGVRGDTTRRVFHIRLESAEERPEERTGFKHDPLIPWVQRERPRLLCAALTILRAYFVAGRPGLNLRPIGSFEGWSSICRLAIVWLDLPDPGDCLAAKEEDIDPADAAHRAILMALDRPDIGNFGLTADQIIKRAESDEDLGAAIRELCPTRDGKSPTAKALGSKLRTVRGRRREVNGESLSLDKAGSERSGAFRWGVKRGKATQDLSLHGLQSVHGQISMRTGELSDVSTAASSQKAADSKNDTSRAFTENELCKLCKPCTDLGDVQSDGDDPDFELFSNWRDWLTAIAQDIGLAGTAWDDFVLRNAKRPLAQLNEPELLQLQKSLDDYTK